MGRGRQREGHLYIRRPREGLGGATKSSLLGQHGGTEAAGLPRWWAQGLGKAWARTVPPLPPHHYANGTQFVRHINGRHSEDEGRGGEERRNRPRKCTFCPPNAGNSLLYIEREEAKKTPLGVCVCVYHQGENSGLCSTSTGWRARGRGGINGMHFERLHAHQHQHSLHMLSHTHSTHTHISPVE